MAAIILAGGKSQRMGNCDKAFLKIGKEPIIKRQLRLLKKHFKKIIIVTNSADKYNGLKGVRIISDIVPHQGPLAGIMSGLMSSGERYNFVVACDMPYVNLKLAKYLFSKLQNGYEVVACKIRGRYEPLFAIYGKGCIGAIEEQLKGKDTKVTGFFSKVKVKTVSEKEVMKIDPELKTFMNINTPPEYKKIY